MSKRFKIFIVLFLILFVIGDIILISKVLKEKEKLRLTKINRVMVNFPSDTKDINFLSNNFLEQFKSSTGIDFYSRQYESTKYLEDISQDLKLSHKGDLYYVVNSSQLLDESIKSSALHFDSNDKVLNNIPESFKTLSNSKNRVTYIPLTAAPWGIYYNKKVFKDLNIQEPKTFSELEELSIKLINEGLIPFAMSQGVKWPITSWFDYISIREYGADFHNRLLAGQIDFNSENVRNIFYTIYELINKNCFDIDGSTNWLNMVEKLEKGEVSMALSSTFFLDEVKDKNNIGWFPFPFNGNFNDEIVSSSGFIISDVTTNIDGVREFIKYLTSNETGFLLENESHFFSYYSRSNREDVIKGIENLKKADKLSPSFERNNNPKLAIPIKYSINKLFTIEDKSDILEILNSLEEYRKSI